MRKLLSAILFLTLITNAFSQTYTAVPVDDPVYEFIDTMIIQGVIPRDVMVRPWPRSKVLSTLEQIQKRSTTLSSVEKEYLAFLIDKTDHSIDKSLMEQGAVNINSDLFPARIGIGWDNEVRTAFSDDIAFSMLSLFNFYLEGDIPGPISYNFNVNAGLISMDFDSYEPYTYTKKWDGAPYHLVGWAPYGFPSELSGGLEILSEIGMSVWDDRFWARFGRMRHDWGTFGSGNLYFASEARPFTAFELTFNPWDWFAFSALTGSLDYGIGTWNEYGSYPVPGSVVNPEDAPPLYSRPKEAAAVEQNSFSIIQFEFMPTERFYFNIFDAVIWAKRHELDYIYPLQSKFFGQEVVGDFDNMMIGGTVAFLAPKYGQAWLSLYIDEMDLLSDNFFSQDRNMYAYQLGTSISIPLFSLGKINLQYTKIEPYTYTHPPVNSPSYSDSFVMQTYYLNNGEALGFYQPPNSDELRLEITTMPISQLTATFKYRMIRHGSIYGTARVDGSSYYDYIDYYEYYDTNSSWKDDPLYRKDFLRDGAYEWQHVFGLGTSWFGDMGKVPFSLGINYDLVWSYYTNYSVTGDFSIYEDAEYQSSLKNIITIFFSLYP